MISHTPVRHRMLRAIEAGTIIMVPRNTRGDLKPRALDQKGLFNLTSGEARAVNDLVWYARTEWVSQSGPTFGPIVDLGMTIPGTGTPVSISEEGAKLLAEWNQHH